MITILFLLMIIAAIIIVTVVTGFLTLLPFADLIIAGLIIYVIVKLIKKKNKDAKKK